MGVRGLARPYGRAVKILCRCSLGQTIPLATRFKETAHVCIELREVPIALNVKTVANVLVDARICISIKPEPCEFLLDTRNAVHSVRARQSTAIAFIMDPNAAYDDQHDARASLARAIFAISIRYSYRNASMGSRLAARYAG